jgi:hypothetical protein
MTGSIVRRHKDPKRVRTRCVRLDLDVDDALCRFSLRHDVSIHQLLRLAARMLVERAQENGIERLVTSEHNNWLDRPGTVDRGTDSSSEDRKND